MSTQNLPTADSEADPRQVLCEVQHAAQLAGCVAAAAAIALDNHETLGSTIRTPGLEADSQDGYGLVEAAQRILQPLPDLALSVTETQLAMDLMTAEALAEAIATLLNEDPQENRHHVARLAPLLYRAVTDAAQKAELAWKKAAAAERAAA